MSFRRRFQLSVSMLALGLGAYSCSHKPSADESAGNPQPDAGAQSSADQVGSVPEDMLADEKGGADANAATAAPAPTDDAAAKPAADPFGDLADKKEDKPADAMAVTDTGGASAEASGSGKMETYTVKAGDTLMKVAFHLYGDVDRWKELQELNRATLKNGNLLAKGTTLRYEAPAAPFEADQLSHTYEIKKGDTLANIADEVYGRKAKFKKLQGYNKHLIKNPNRIFAGFTIYYDITEKEVAEAEAHRAQRQAGGMAAAAPATSTETAEVKAEAAPSAINPPAEAKKAEKKVATNPTASDGSAASLETAGPPSPKK